MTSKKMPDFSRIPHSAKECRDMRVDFLKELYESKDTELGKFVTQEMNAFKRQGSAYGMLVIGIPLGLAFFKFPKYKPHIPGAIVGLTIGYVIGGFCGLDLGHKPVFEKLGVIKEDPELEARRVEIHDKCQNV